MLHLVVQLLKIILNIFHVMSYLTIDYFSRNILQESFSYMHIGR